MYFYRISAAGYEESFVTTFYSSEKYSQEEFEDIVVEAYQKACKQYIDEDEGNVCFAWDFKVNEIIWDYYNHNFNRIMEEDYGFHSLSKKLTAHVVFDLTHYGKKEEINLRVQKALDEIEIDESCWDNECSRQPNSKEDIPWFRSECLVFKRKSSRIKDKNCDNCISKPYNNPNCNGKVCNAWKWDGNGTLKN